MEASAAELDLGIELATDLADMADTISTSRHRAPDLIIERKPDLSPVTEADQLIEREMRRIITAAQPDHAILGEEYGATGPASGHWRWVVDPIDGTKSYVRGAESWATLIALEYDDVPVVAVASMPAFGHRFSAVRGRGALMNGNAISVSAVDDIAAAVLGHTSLGGFVAQGLDITLRNLAGRCWDARGFGNSLAHLSVARGSAEIGWTSRAYLWDFAALSLIVEEAGGRFTDPSGGRARGGNGGVSSNGLLHTKVLDLLATE